MTKAEEKALLGTIDNLMKIVGNMEQGMQLMTGALVEMEKRLNAVEGKKDSPSRLILPPALRN